MAAKKYVQALTQYLAGSGVIIGATSIVLTSLTDIYGNAITSITSFGDKGYITLEPDTTNEEGATFTTVTVNANGTVTLGGVSTILAQSPYTETSGLVRAHAGGTKLVITDNVSFWNTFGNLNNANTWADIQTFSVPGVQATDPTASAQVANKHYVDSVAVAGAPNASTTVKGIVELATQAEVLSKSTTGGTGALLTVTPDTLASTLLSDYKVDTGAANAYVITPAPAVTAYTTGQIFSFKAINACTTASTLNVNGLGTKAIVNSKGGALVSGDISAAMIVTVEYDGTSMVMQNPVANTPTVAASSYSADVQSFTSTGANTWTKPTTLTPKKVFVQIWGGGASGGKGNAANGGGGGSGEYIEAWFNSSDLGSSVTVTVGAGGVAKAAAGSGNVGGNTTFGALLTAVGGNGGDSQAAADATGGNGGFPTSFTAVTGLWGLGVSASTGGAGLYSAAGGGTSNGGGTAAPGGASVYGGGGGGGSTTAGAGATGAGGTSVYGGAGGAGGKNGNGVDGVQPAGGGGANSGTGSSGKGGDGKAIVTTFF